MGLLTETSLQMLNELTEREAGKSLQELLEQDFLRYESPGSERRRAEASKCGLAKFSTTTGYNPQGFGNYFR